MNSRRPRVGRPGRLRYAWTLAAILLAGCSGDTGDFLSIPESTTAPEGAIAWQEGSGETRTYLGAEVLIRCWKLSTRFDCLYADVFDIREQIADAPVRRSYYRFLTGRLPDRLKQLGNMDTSDGYECATSTTRDGSTMLEAIWKGGRIVEQSSTNLHLAEGAAWSQQQVAELFNTHAITPQRPVFACALVDEIATKMGLQALDSPLVTYETLTQIDRYPATEAEVGPAE